MATKKERIREADQIVDQNVAPVSAQPATPEEVAQAPVEVPADQVVEPIVDEPVVDEPPVEVNPETIDMQVQIPTDQIAAAVAQATGDVVPAETAPDAVEAKQAEEEPMVAEETVPEGSVEAPSPQPVMESMEEDLDNKQYPLGVEIFDFIEGSCPNCTDEQMADKVVSQFGIDKAKATKAVGLFHKGCVLMESEKDEDEDVLDNIDVPEEEDPADLPDSFAPADGDSDIDDLFSEEPDDDELLDKIEDFVNSDDHSTEDVSDALRIAAAFLDQIADDKKFSFADVVGEPAEEDEIDEGPMTDNEEDLQESKKKSLSKRMREADNCRIREYDGDHSTRYSVEMETDKVFIGDPCYAMDKDVYRSIWGDVLDYADGPIENDGIGYGVAAYTRYGDGDYKGSSFGAMYPVDSGTLGITNLMYRRNDRDDDDLNRLGKVIDIPSGKCIAELVCSCDSIDCNILDAVSKKEIFNERIYMDQYEEEEDEDYSDDYYESIKNKQSKLRESNKPISRKPVRLTSRPVVTERHSLKESGGIVYPAGSRPIGRSDEEDLVARQERVHEARRKAIREYRQKVVSQREQSRPANTGRFNEALRDSVRSIKESADPKSWAANTFMDKYEESSKLNYKELLKNGFLG